MQTGCLGVMLHLKSSCLACNWLVHAHMAAYMCARTNYAHTHTTGTLYIHTWYLVRSDGVKIGVPGFQRVNGQMFIMRSLI